MSAKKTRPPKEATLAVRVTAWTLFALVVGASVELACQLAYKAMYQQWRFAVVVAKDVGMFEQHPYLVGTPRPYASVTYGDYRATHSSQGTRGHEFNPVKAPGVRRIVTMGGSSTYDSRVTDESAWPMLLERELGNGYEVINLGVPGYSTAEHVIQTALNISALSPDFALYYIGWNDIRNMHIRNLKPDYSNFHGRQQFSNLQLGAAAASTRIASVYFFRNLMQSWLGAEDGWKFSLEGSESKFTDRIDPNALRIYERNLRSLVALCRSLGIRPVLVPQLLNYSILTADEPYAWIPYIKKKDLKVTMAAYNEAMRRIASDLHADFVEGVLKEPFGPGDFMDEGHFSPGGSQKFARILSQHIRSVR